MKDLLFAIFITNTLTSIIGGGFYLINRWAERYFPGLLLWGGFLFAFICIGLIVVFPFIIAGAIVVILGALLPSAVGGWLHEKSGGASADDSAAYALVFYSTFLSGTVGAALFIWIVSEIWFSTQFPNIAMWWAVGGLLLYPSLTPLGVWIWRSLRLRPGLDVALSDANRIVDGES